MLFVVWAPMQPKSDCLIIRPPHCAGSFSGNSSLSHTFMYLSVCLDLLCANAAQQAEVQQSKCTYPKRGTVGIKVYLVVGHSLVMIARCPCSGAYLWCYAAHAKWPSQRQTWQCNVLHRLYQQLQRDQKGLPGLTQSNRRMWEQAIEAACRAGHTEWALQVCLPV